MGVKKEDKKRALKAKLELELVRSIAKFQGEEYNVLDTSDVTNVLATMVARRTE